MNKLFIQFDGVISEVDFDSNEIKIRDKTCYEPYVLIKHEDIENYSYTRGMKYRVTIEELWDDEEEQ